MAWLSVGVSNQDLCDKMVDLGLLEDGPILEAFRNTDRGDFVLEKDRSEAYLDRPFKKGNIHLSAPHMYATVLGGLELEPGLSMLNVGSGSGYLSCLASHLIGPSGICHGIDINEDVVTHSKLCAAKWLQRRINTQLETQNIDTSNMTYDSSFQTEKRLLLNRSMLEESISFVSGNCFHLNAQNAISFARYDRIYVGAACPETHKMFFYNLLQINGILVLPIIETNKMLKIKRISDYIFTTSTLSNVTFAPLISTNDVTEYLEASSKYCNLYHTQVFKELFEEEIDPEAGKNSNSGGGGSSSSGSSRSGGSKKTSPRSPSSAAMMSPTMSGSGGSSSISSGGGSALSSSRKRKVPSMTQNILTAEPESLILQRTVTDHINLKALSSPTVGRKRLLMRRTPSSSSGSTAGAVGGSVPTTPMAMALPHRVDLPSIVWQPNKYRHQQFPESFRRAALTLLMCSRYSQRHDSVSLTSVMMTSSASCGSSSSSAYRQQQQLQFIGSTLSVCSSSSSTGHHSYARYDSLPTQLWYLILSYCNRDWFTPPTSPLQVLSHELLAERQLHLVTRHRLEEAEAARREAERERDLYRAVMLRMSRKQGGGGGNGCLGSSVLTGTTHLLSHIFGDHAHVGFDTDEEGEHEEEEEEEQEEDDEGEEEEEEAMEEEESENEEEQEEEEDEAMEGEHTEFTDDEVDGEDDEEQEEEGPVVGSSGEHSPAVPVAVTVATESEVLSPSDSSAAGPLTSISLTAEEQEDDMAHIAASIQATVAQSLLVVNRVETALSPLLQQQQAAAVAVIGSPTAHSTTEEEGTFVTAPSTPNLLPALLDRYAVTIENRQRNVAPSSSSGGGNGSRSYDTSCATSLESASTLPGYRLSLSSSLESHSDDNIGVYTGSNSFTSSAMNYLCDPSRYSEASGDEHTVLSSSAVSVASSSSNSRQPSSSHIQYSKNIPIASPSRQQQQLLHQNILFRPGSGSGRSRGESSGKSGPTGGASGVPARDSDDDTSSDDESSLEDEEEEGESIDHFYWY